jgi:hypothetical protein
MATAQLTVLLGASFARIAAISASRSASDGGELHR